MATLTPTQLRRRQRIEAGLRIAAPALDLVLAVGERISRLAERDDDDRYPARPATRGEVAARSRDPRAE